MPIQPLHLPQAARRGRDRLTWPRALLVALASIATAAFAHLLYQVLSVVQLTMLQGVFLVLCTMCFAWIALGTSSAVLGFFSFRRGRDVAEFDAMAVDGVRTALLFPVYQEDTARIAATVECIAQELVALGAEKRFDVFVLSDSPAGRHQGQGAACRALPAPAPAQCLSNLLPVQGTERRQEGRQHR